MDDDIQDILASVSAPTIPQRTLDLQALTRAWVNERTAPELLPYPTSLVERVMDRVTKQVDLKQERGVIEVLTIIKVDRNNRRDDWNDGPQSEFHAGDPSNRTGAIQVPHSIVSTSENSQGKTTHYLPRSQPTCTNKWTRSIKHPSTTPPSHPPRTTQSSHPSNSNT